MSNSQLVGSSFIDGLRAPHYVDGRLLTADDLATDQQATLTRLAWLGLACGAGVVEGLTVGGQGNELRVEPGIGVNRSGAVFRLPGPVALALTLRAPAAEEADAGRFQRCGLTSGSSEKGIAGGAYLLVATPASRLEGVAPVKGAPAATGNPGCVARWEVEGLQFKAISLQGFSPGAFSLDGDAGERRRQVSRLRSRLAHWCYGSAKLRELPRDPFGFGGAYSGLDGIAAGDLTPCDLPLAVFHWTGSALTFVDHWSARRRPVRPGGLDGWHAVLDDRRVAEGQARFLQFQGQLAGLEDIAASVKVVDYFDWLPPAGLFPIRVSGEEQVQGLYRFADSLAYQDFLLDILLDLFLLRFGRDDPANVAFVARMRELGAAGGRACARVISALLQEPFAAAGFEPTVFAEGLQPGASGYISGDSVDTLLAQSWLDEAVELATTPLVDAFVVVELLTDVLVRQLYDLAGTSGEGLKLLVALTATARNQARRATATAPEVAMASSLAHAARMAEAATSDRAEQSAEPTRRAILRRVRKEFSQLIAAGAARSAPTQLYGVFVKRSPPPYFPSSDQEVRKVDVRPVERPARGGER